LASFQHGSALDAPLERLALLDVSMDWITFWLQDDEHPSPENAEHYARWRKMRDAEWIEQA
jgi:hypothetical protein